MPEQDQSHRYPLPRRRAMFASAAVAGLLAATSCDMPENSFEYAGEGEPVATVRIKGDSLIFGANGFTYDETSQDIMGDTLQAAGYGTDVVALVGATTNDMVNGINPDHLADISVLAFGSNDMKINETSGQSNVAAENAAQNIETYMTNAQSDCYVLVNIATESTSWGLDITGPAWNNTLAQIALEHGSVYVDWASIANDHPEYLDPGDLVHHTEAGKEAYRQAIYDGVDACANQIG